MLLQPLMLNPRKAAATATLGAYVTFPGNSFDVAYSPSAGTLTFKGRFTSMPIVGTNGYGVASNKLVARAETVGTSKLVRRYSVSAKGAQANAIDSHPVPSAPSGYNVIAPFGTGDVFFNNGNNVFVASVLDGVTAGPLAFVASGGGYRTDGEHLLRLVGTTMPVNLITTGNGTTSDGSGITYTTFTPYVSESPSVGGSLSSRGLSDLAFPWAPFVWASGSGVLIRAVTLTIGSAEWHAPGSLRIAVSGSTLEVFDDGPNGATDTFYDQTAQKNVTYVYRTVRVARTAFVGVLTVTGNSVSLVIHERVTSIRTYTRIVFFQDDPTKYYNPSSRTSGLDVTAAFTTLQPQVLTRNGMYSKIDNATYAFTDGNQVVRMSAPPGSPGGFYNIPGMDAVVATVPDTFFVQGQCYVSLDQGASWTGPITQYRQNVGATSATKSSSVPVPLFPLLP